MANEDLNKAITLEARPITAADFPQGWPFPLIDYLLRSQDSEQAIINKTNQASSGAYQAQVSNEQNSSAIDGLSSQLSDQDKRVFAVEESTKSNSLSISEIKSEVSDIEEDVGSFDERLTNIENDYVSLTKVAEQTLSSPISVTDSYSVNGVKVVGARVTGWTAATGTAYLGAFDADQAYTVSATYTQAEVQAIVDGLTEARQRVKALEDALRSHGLID